MRFRYFFIHSFDIHQFLTWCSHNAPHRTKRLLLPERTFSSPQRTTFMKLNAMKHLLARVMLLLVLTGWGIVPTAQAGDVLQSYVTHRDGTYSLHIQMRVRGDADVIRGLVTDFNHLEKLDDFIVGSEQLASEVPGEKRMRIVTRDCFFLYCAQLVQEQQVRNLPNGTLEVEIIPEHSDYSQGRSLWSFIQQDDGTTILTVDAKMAPKLWVPPLVGPEIVASRMRLHSEGMIQNMERLASIMTAEERRRLLEATS